MIRIAIVFLFVLGIAAAHAQQQPFVPITVNEAEYKALRSWLDEQPMKFALPVAQWLEQAERRAVDDKAAAEKAKSAPAQ